MERIPKVVEWTVQCRGVVSYSDGPPGQATGRLLFYLTTMDATAFDLEVIA